jgi:hypothetical protein
VLVPFYLSPLSLSHRQLEVPKRPSLVCCNLCRLATRRPSIVYMSHVAVLQLSDQEEAMAL